MILLKKLLCIIFMVLIIVACGSGGGGNITHNEPSPSEENTSSVILWQNAIAHVTTRPHNRKIVWDDNSGYFYAFFGTDNTLLVNRWKSSPDGVTWSNGGVAFAGNGNSSGTDVLLDGDQIIYLHSRNSLSLGSCSCRVKSFDINAGDLTDSGTDVALASWTCSGTSPEITGYGSIAKDTNGYYWVVTQGGCDTCTHTVKAWRSTIVNSIAAWDPPVKLATFPAKTETAPDIIALDSGKMIVIMETDDTWGGTNYQVRVALYDGSQWGASYQLLSNTAVSNKMRSTAEFDSVNQILHFLYIDNNAILRHRTLVSPYDQDNWSLAPGIFVASGLRVGNENDTSLELDTSTNPAGMYAVYVTSDTYYKIKYYNGTTSIWGNEGPFGIQSGGASNEAAMIKSSDSKFAALYVKGMPSGYVNVYFQMVAMP